MMPIYALLIFVLVLVVGLAQAQFRARRIASVNWEDLVAKLQSVPMDGIRTVALKHLDPGMDQIDLQPNDLWQMIGGEEGLERMRANADVLIALAAYSQRWNKVESVIVAERMRRDALALKRAIRRIGFSVFFGIGRTDGAFSVNEAASAYYLMRQRLLALYEVSYREIYPVLAAAA